jgi:signal peptidase
MIGFLLVGLLAAIYLIINLVLPHIGLNPQIATYLIQPLLWGTVIAAVKFMPDYRPLGKNSKKSVFIQFALGMAAIQILFYIVGGLFSGFGKSPSSFTPLGISENIFYVGMMLIGMELSRAWLVTQFGKKNTFLVILFATLLFTFISIPFRQITGFQLRITSSNQVISSWLPLLAENLAASLLVLMAGAEASLAFRGLLAAFWWLCPILPNLDWAMKGLIGTIIPVIGIVAINNYYVQYAARGRSRKRARNTSIPAGWIITTIIAVATVWFAVGVFPVKPFLVPSGSMVPVISPGDVVLIAPVNADAIKVGEIIEYRSVKENINIVHRVIEITGNAPDLFFITKGDANNSPDPDPVSTQAVMGREIIVVPKIGWLSIAVKKLLSG